MFLDLLQGDPPVAELFDYIFVLLIVHRGEKRKISDALNIVWVLKHM